MVDLAVIKILLTEKQMEEITMLMEEISEAWNTQIIWRTWVEAKFSVLNDIKFPTKAAKYHQAAKEQLVFFENLVELSFDYREAIVDFEELTEQIITQTGHELDRSIIKRDRLLFKIQGMELQAKDRVREIKMWSQIKASLNDGSFDTKDKNKDELLGLTLRYCRELPAARRSKETGALINIAGQAETMLKECERQGILEKLGYEGSKARKMLKDL